MDTGGLWKPATAPMPTAGQVTGAREATAWFREGGGRARQET